MKTVELDSAQIEACVAEAQKEQVVLTREGRAVAVLIGVDAELERLGSSEQLWDLITERRRQPTISREELVHRLDTRRR